MRIVRLPTLEVEAVAGPATAPFANPYAPADPTTAARRTSTSPQSLSERPVDRIASITAR
ncbi:hypothetical protein WK28_12075 [Burkholderia vietnamiensis]|nr:hypothetical protein WK28_12075 [Burkholderia vietnamiensis]